jgi:hypothetical protein
MRSLAIARSATVTALVVLIAAASTAQAADEGFKPLFDGKTLAGWQGDPELWTVEDEAIAGSTDVSQIKKNQFLVTDKEYGNFVLKLKFKLRNGNSGIQYRSKATDDFVASGYQADIADQRFMGILYDERGRGILADVKPDEVAKHVKNYDWNEYVITADGPHITQTINGFTTVDYTEKDENAAKKGIIALQLHVGPKMRVWFKDIEVKELP